MLRTYEEVASFIRDFEACCLPKIRWTHQAHLTAGFWYLQNHELGQALTMVRERIWRHNESVGTANTDSGGYHETITRLYMTAIAKHVALHRHLSFDESLASLLASPPGDSAWPLEYYSRERLFSVAARRGWVEPDLRSIDELAVPAKVQG
jgi:hypothetical protein